jgi:hypothetical protein
MKRPANICSLLANVLVLVLLTACFRPSVKTTQSPEIRSEAAGESRGFDPLELPCDREVVPAKHPREGSITGRRGVSASGSDQSHDTLVVGSNELLPSTDTANSQVYRVQIFTGLVHGEARQIARVAEEIFDQPVYVDYEVPNYKVRVGDWLNRDDAGRYRQKARTVGYTNAWVVMVSVDVRETQPLYDDRITPKQPVSEPHRDSVRVTDEGGGVDD